MPIKDIERRRKATNEYNKLWYSKNKIRRLKQIRKSNNARIRVLREHVNAIKERAACTDCKVKYRHWIMEFDHVHGKKVMAIADMVRRAVSIGKLETELAKCELVCSNCHRDRTHRRRNAGVAPTG